MFEKEAEEYVKANNLEWELECHRTSPIGEVNQAFQKGAEFGYNKANEWHYPSKGELPKEDTAEKETLYLLWFGLDDSDYMTGLFSHGRFWCFDSGWFETNEVIAWKEIVFPKEDEIESEMFPEITLPEGSSEFIDKVIADAEKRIKEIE